MTTTQRNKCLKVKSDLERIFDGELNKYQITPYEAYHIAESYNKIVQDGKVETIIENVKNFFSKRKFTVKASGIGWIISL